MSARSLKGVLLGALALSGCAGPIAVMDPHADAGSRMHAIAQRFDADRQKGGMSSVIADIEQCYASATVLVVKTYALRDCIVLDYVGYRADVVIGRHMLHGPPLPFFEDRVFAIRADHYARLDGFTSPERLSRYLRDTNDLVQFDLAQLYAAPAIWHTRKPVPLGQHHVGLE